MITGRKPKELVSEGEAIASSRLWIAGLVAAGVIGALAWIVLHAPAAGADSLEF
jgi:hypothetical protein